MATTKVLKVGVIGASAQRGWAKDSHVPAVQKLAGLELYAVATNEQKSADAAAQAFGAKRGYPRAEDLIRDSDVDVVSVTVKVPAHRELVLAAVEAGKHVYCEWPLGRNVAESEELAAAARAAGVHVAIGLQTRANPAAQRARELVSAGMIGRPLSARAYDGTVAFASKIGEADAYLEDAENGATLVSIHGGHTMDLASAVLGGLEDVTALATTQYPTIAIGSGGKQQARSIPDHIFVQARIAGGAALSVEVAGGRPTNATPFWLEITGEEGDLVLEGGAPRGFQSGRLRLKLKGEPQRIDEGEVSSFPDGAVNVGLLYAGLRDDIKRGTFTVTGFEHAVRLTRLLEDVLLSAETGARKRAAEWPEG